MTAIQGPNGVLGSEWLLTGYDAPLDRKGDLLTTSVLHHDLEADDALAADRAVFLRWVDSVLNGYDRCALVDGWCWHLQRWPSLARIGMIGVQHGLLNSLVPVAVSGCRSDLCRVQHRLP